MILNKTKTLIYLNIYYGLLAIKDNKRQQVNCGPSLFLSGKTDSFSKDSTLSAAIFIKAFYCISQKI